MTLQERFQKMDADRDGILSEQEFVAAHNRFAQQVARSLFTEVGGRSDRPLALDQIAEARKEWSKRVAPFQPERTPERTTNEVFENMDRDHDGGVSEAEFVSYCVREAEDRAEAVFHGMGGSKDNGLTFEQFERGVHARWKTARRHSEGTEFR